MNNTPEKKPFLTMTASPHIKSPVTTQKIMLDVLIALLPTVLWSVYVFGTRCLAVIAVSIISSILFEYLYRLVMKKNNTVSDLSAAVTGLLLALSLPSSVPLWLCVIGSFFAIVIVKQLYGGIGKNVVNPALAARVFLFIAFPKQLTSYPYPLTKIPTLDSSIDVTAAATPLVQLKNGALPQDDIISCLLGSIPGTIGEVSASLLLLGGLYLIFKKVITWHIPVCYLGTVAILSLIFPQGNISGLYFMLYELFTGGLMLGAIFMATDYTTSPVTTKGRIIYAVGCGAVTIFIRYFGGYPEGVSFAILIMNLFVWYLDKLTKPVNFGGAKNATK